MGKSFVRKATLSAVAIGAALTAAAVVAPAANATSVPSAKHVAAQNKTVPASPKAPSAKLTMKEHVQQDAPPVKKGAPAFNATIANKSSNTIAVLVGWDGVRGNENWQWLGSGGSLKMDRTAFDSIDNAWVYFPGDAQKFPFTIGPWINPSFLSFGSGAIVDGGTHWLEDENSSVTSTARGHQFTVSRNADIPAPEKYAAPTPVMGISFNS